MPGLPKLTMEYLRKATIEEAIRRTSTSTEESYPDFLMDLLDYVST